MSTSNKSNFRRAQSKVWWGNNSDHNQYGFLSLQQITKSNKSNVSPDITTSWSYRRGSPGSLKSQDSGFSDSDNSPPANHHGSKNSSQQSSSNDCNHSLTISPDKLTPKKTVNHQINTEIFQRSPSICSERSTPPTVIRKKLNVDFASTSRRISFSAPSSPVYERVGSPDLLQQIDSLNYSSTSPVSLNNSRQALSDMKNKCDKNRSIKRGTTITRSAGVNRRLLKCASQFSIGSASDVYQLSSSGNSNESIQSNVNVESDVEASIMMQKAIPQTPKSILKASPKKYNNETVVFGCGVDDSRSAYDLNHGIQQIEPALPTYSALFPTSTSTPKGKEQAISRIFERLRESSPEFIDLSATMNWETCTYIEYTNPLLNGHASSVQYWLDEIRSTYCHEVLSTLQTKSITQVIKKSAAVNSVTAGKIIRSLQTKAENLQRDFECIEQLLTGNLTLDVVTIVSSLVTKLNENIIDFVSRLRSKNIFGSTDDTYDRFEDNISCITEMTLDMQAVVDNRSEDVDFNLLFEDLQVLKRYLLITIRLVFAKLIKIILNRIETTKCDLILRSNVSTISILSNTEFKNFASLNDAFIDSDAVRLLLALCLESKLSTVRTLALRALATICSTNEAIRQFQQVGGTEILTEILTDDMNANRLEPEFREALSLLAQITAPWHGKTHSITGLKANVEKLVERISDIVTETTCCQTLLLCAACLNNLSRMETTSIYSLMSHGTVLKLRHACQARGPGASIFLFVSCLSISRLHLSHIIAFVNRNKLLICSTIWLATRNATNTWLTNISLAL